MNDDKVFFDTNVLIYAVASDAVRTPAARSWIAKGGSISVQVLNEFANTARRKLRRPWEDVVDALAALRALSRECLSITEQTHDLAVGLARRYGFSFYDALIVASALEANCTTLLTEDMQAGQVIDGRLTVHNPFSRS
jgi:predicted nucleic acid-binding protein